MCAKVEDEWGGYNPFRYNIQYTDAESGLIYLRARYYDPSIGRFMAEDPAKGVGTKWLRKGESIIPSVTLGSILDE